MDKIDAVFFNWWETSDPEYRTGRDGFLAGYHARDAEIERLKAGIEELRDWLAKVAARELFFTEDSFISRRDFCDKLLKGDERWTQEEIDAAKQEADRIWQWWGKEESAGDEHPAR